MHPIRKIMFFFLWSLLVAGPAWSWQEWPLEIEDPQGTIVIYQPQPEELKGGRLTGRFAMEVAPSGSTITVFGAAWFAADLDMDLEKCAWTLERLAITKARIRNFAPEQEKAFAQIVEEALPEKKLRGSLSGLLATMELTKQNRESAEKFGVTPPKIMVFDQPTVLVPIDGQPKLENIPDSKLQWVVNTPMMMIYDPGNAMFFLTSGDLWYGADKVLGPWRVQTNLPKGVESLVTRNGKPLAISPGSRAKLPQIVVSTEPAEVIATEGSPQMQTLGQAGLLYLSNSGSDVFLESATRKYYYLVSGRWFTAPALAGPWQSVNPKNLPPAFAAIPPDSPKGNVLVSVPGTPQAADALIESQIPQTAVIQRSQARLSLIYNGAPEFKPIAGTKLQYAVNTATPVLLIRGQYFACDNALWFTATTPKGPWVVTSLIPPEVQSLPPDCPIYNVKYVYVYDSNPDEIDTGYTSGYLGYYPFQGCVVYGTGYYYNPWYKAYYYPRPYTYGYGVHYSPDAGWSAGFGYGMAFIGAGAAWHAGWSRGGYYPGYHPPAYHGHPGGNQNSFQGAT